MAHRKDERSMEGRPDGTIWYETPTGIIVPVPPISGGSDAAGVPAPTPAAPDPADSAPGSDAPISPGSVAPPPITSPAPPSPVAPDVGGVRTALDGIFTDPNLGPVAGPRTVPTPAIPSPAGPPTTNPRVAAAWDAYQRAPDDRAAFTHLINTAVELGEERVLSRLEAREVAQVNQTRQHQRNAAIVQTVNDAVAKEAPDVHLDLFWSYGRRAQAETPRNLVHPSERIEWPMRRMIELTRAKQQAVITAASSPAPRAGVSQPATPGASGQPKSMVDQMRDLRRSQVSW
jgi:hypothetical protein